MSIPYPITVQTFVTQVSTQLNDQEVGFTFLRWTVLELLSYLNEALLEVCFYRPDQFTNTTDIPINATQGGWQQSLPPYSRLLISINFNGATSLCPGYPITEADLSLSKTFYKQPCGPSSLPQTYKVLSYSYDAKRPLLFYVSPPVPGGVTSTVNATVVYDPVQYTITDFTGGVATLPSTLDPKFYNALRFFMLGKAYEVDTESQTSQAESQGYYKKFYNTLGVAYKQGGDYNKGQFLGQGGDNRMTKQRVT